MGQGSGGTRRVLTEIGKHTSFCLSYFAALTDLVEKEMLSELQSRRRSNIQKQEVEVKKKKPTHQHDCDTHPLR